MSCLIEDNHGFHSNTTTTQAPPTTTTTTIIPVTEETEDPDFCQDKADGLYAHPDCDKFYQCYHKGKVLIDQKLSL